MKRYLIIFISLAFCFTLSACGFLTSFMRSSENRDVYDSAEQYTAGSFTYNAADVDAIEVFWLSGVVDLEKGYGTVLTATESVEDVVEGERTEEERLHHWIDGHTLYIHFSGSDYQIASERSQKHLMLKIPADVDLTVNAASAKVRIHKLTVNDLQISSTSGNLISDILTAENIILNTDSGDIRIDDSEAREITINTTSGEVGLENVTCGSTRITSDSGNIQVKLPKDTGVTLDFQTESGSLSYSTPFIDIDGLRIIGNGAYMLSVETVSGKMKIGYSRKPAAQLKSVPLASYR